MASLPRSCGLWALRFRRCPIPPEKHALLSASSASRWLACTEAPRFEEGLPESTSDYAEEGRLAHAIAELKVLKKFTIMTNRTYNSRQIGRAHV